MKSTLLVNFMICLGLGALPRPARAQGSGPFSSFTQFSAALTEHDTDNTVATGKMYRSGQRMRLESPLLGPGGYTFTVLGEKTWYLVSQGVCMEMDSVDPEHPNPFELTGNTTRKEVGSEVIDGHPTRIEQITVASAAGKPVTIKAWKATDLKGFPVRIEVPTPKGTMRMDLQNVDLSVPPASLFVTPQGCSPMPQTSGKQD